MKHEQRNFLGIIRLIVWNKYFFVLLLFLLYLTFFDDHNLIKRYNNQQDIKQLEQEYQYYLDDIEANKTKIHQLKNDSAYLEKFAREEFFMKKDKEEVFIIK